MRPKNLQRSVLLFTRSPGREAAAKRLSGGAALFASLRDRAVAAAEALGVDLVVVGDPGAARLPAGARVLRQRGRGFGERLANAFTDVASLGYAAIVAVGTDSPGLGPLQLAAAFEALDERTLVLGPAPDGGAFLIGLRVDLAAPGALFRGIAWRTDRVLAQLTARQADVALLAGPVADVDGRGDLKGLLADPRLPAALGLSLVRLIAALLHDAPVATPSREERARRLPLPALLALRGPPASLLSAA